MAKRKRSKSYSRRAAIRRSNAAQSAKPEAKKVDFAKEYHYVLGDLKRIAILAAAMFALLVILALVLG